MISEDRLRQAVRDAGALLDQSLPDPDQCHHTFSPAFLNRMEALLRRRKRAPVYRVLKGVACFFLLGERFSCPPMPRHGRHSLGGYLNKLEAPSIIDSTTMSRRQHTVIGFLKFRLDTGKQTVMKLKPQEMNSMKTRPENI